MRSCEVSLFEQPANSAFGRLTISADAMGARLALAREAERALSPDKFEASFETLAAAPAYAFAPSPGLVGVFADDLEKVTATSVCGSGTHPGAMSRRSAGGRPFHLQLLDWRPRSSSNSQAVLRPRSRDLVIFISNLPLLEARRSSATTSNECHSVGHERRSPNALAGRPVTASHRSDLAVSNISERCFTRTDGLTIHVHRASAAKCPTAAKLDPIGTKKIADRPQEGRRWADPVKGPILPIYADPHRLALVVSVRDFPTAFLTAGLMRSLEMRKRRAVPLCAARASELPWSGSGSVVVGGDIKEDIDASFSDIHPRMTALAERRTGASDVVRPEWS